MKRTLLLSSLCLALEASAESYQWQEEMKGSFRKGFLLTCLPAIESQLERAGVLQLFPQEKRISYCTCVGIKIFDDLTLAEIKRLMDSGDLPARKQSARPRYSNECGDSELT